MRFEFSLFKVKFKYSVFLFILLFNQTGYTKQCNDFKDLHPLSNYEDNLP